ncbi:MAG: FISUMP domain-containing protein [Saprospiraceae bacterium]
MSDKTSPHIAGRYAIIVALIGLIVTFGAVYLGHYLTISREKTISEKDLNSGTFIDTRDSQVYKWVRLKDGKKWMVENLNYETTDSWCYNNEKTNCVEYGRLYTWDSAMRACPNGWRLPTDVEFEKIISQYKGNSNNWRKNGSIAYKRLLKNGDSKFSALCGGIYHVNGSIHFPDFHDIGVDGYYWTCIEQNSSYAKVCHFMSMDNFLLIRDFGKVTLGLSCRCLQD